MWAPILRQDLARHDQVEEVLDMYNIIRKHTEGTLTLRKDP